MSMYCRVSWRFYSNADSGSGVSTLWSLFCISESSRVKLLLLTGIQVAFRVVRPSTIKNILTDLNAKSRNKYWPQLGLVPAVQ